MIDVESLLVDAPQSPPGGPDLEYDPAYLELEQLARGKPDQQFGNTVIAAEEPPWPELLERAVGLLQRSKDLRVASIAVRALVHTQGFAGLLPGLQLLLGLFERFWDDLHPRLDADDDNDPTMRMNALAPLVDPLVLLRELRAASFVRSRQHGAIVVYDIEVLQGKLPPRNKAAPPSQAQADAVLAAAAAEEPAALARVPQTLAAAKALAGLLDAKIGAGGTPDFKPLLATLYTLTQACGKYVATPAASTDGIVVGTDGAAAAAVAPEPIRGEIRSRDDALLMIDKIVEYLESHEPTNPAPLLLRRGKRFMSMSFVDIVKEISPDSMAKIDAIAGPAPKEK